MGGRTGMEVVYYQLARCPKGLKVRIIEILYGGMIYRMC